MHTRSAPQAVSALRPRAIARCRKKRAAVQRLLIVHRNSYFPDKLNTDSNSRFHIIYLESRYSAQATTKCKVCRVKSYPCESFAQWQAPHSRPPPHAFRLGACCALRCARGSGCCSLCSQPNSSRAPSRLLHAYFVDQQHSVVQDITGQSTTGQDVVLCHVDVMWCRALHECSRGVVAFTPLVT